MSSRNFARSCKAKTGRTPAKAVEVFRLEAARRPLEETEHGVDRIAHSCGFSDEERMRTMFQLNQRIDRSQLGLKCWRVVTVTSAVEHSGIIREQSPASARNSRRDRLIGAPECDFIPA
jgi:hypothetical protein